MPTSVPLDERPAPDEAESVSPRKPTRSKTPPKKSKRPTRGVKKKPATKKRGKR